LMRDLIPVKVRRKRRPKVKNLPDLPVAEEALREADAFVPVSMSSEEDG